MLVHHLPPVIVLCGHRASNNNLLLKSAALAALSLLLSTLNGHAADVQQKDIQQKTEGPCSSAIAGVGGSVTVNCIFITFDTYMLRLQNIAESQRKAAEAGDSEAQKETAYANLKLKKIDDAYASYLEAAHSYLRRLDSFSGILDSRVVEDAATGSNDAPQRILATLSSSNTKDSELISYALELGDLLEAQGDIAGARAAYEKARQRRPMSGILLRKFSSLLYETGRASEAIAILEAILSNNQKDASLTNADLAWIYDALGQSLQATGNLDSSDDQFKFAIQMGGLALKDGTFTRSEFAAILNDSAGPLIRKKEFKRAEANLCKSVTEFAASSGVNKRSALNAEMNLSTVQREQGRWGDANAILEGIISKTAGLIPDDPLIGYSYILKAQVEFYIGNIRESEGYLDRSLLYFEPRYKKFGAHAQRLARVHHFRALISMRSANWNHAIDEAGRAIALFQEAYGANSFDEAIVRYWEITSLIEAQRPREAEESLSKMRRIVQFLRVKEDKSLLAYISVLEGLLLFASGDKLRAQHSIEEAIYTLFEIENFTSGYDTLADSAIRWVLLLENTQTDTTTDADIRSYRSAHKARLPEHNPQRRSIAGCSSGI